MTPEVAEAQRAIISLRGEISRFQRLRTANNEIIAGVRPGKLTWEQAQVVAGTWRDAGMEKAAVDNLRQVITLLQQGETGAQLDLNDPLPTGIEEGLGWLLPVAGAVVAAATAAYSAFSYMRTREERIMEETRGPVAAFWHQLGENTWALAALAALGLGGFIYYDTQFRKVQIIRGREDEDYEDEE